MVNLTFKDILHEKTRFVLIILGLTVSMVMVNFGIGFLTGSMQDNETFIKNHDQYDAYITQENRQNIFDGGQVSDSIFNRTSRISFVKDAQQLVIEGLGVMFDEEIVGCSMVGYDVFSDIGPWDIIEGKEVSLVENFTTIVDISILRFLPSLEVGDKITTGYETELEIVGFCKNSKHWGNPYAWVSYETSRLVKHKENVNASTVIAVDLKSGFSIKDLKNKLDENDVNIHSDEDLIEDLENEVLDNMGSSIGMLALMGFIVTMIIVSATMYSTVMEKIPQLVSMKALGAGQGFINRILISQVVLFITIAAVLAFIISLILQPIVSAVTIYSLGFDLFWILTTYGIALNLGILCTIASMRKVKKTDPAIIFRG